MKALIFFLTFFSVSSIGAQTIYSPIKYEGGVQERFSWYQDSDGYLSVYVPDNEEGRAFVAQFFKDVDADIKSPYFRKVEGRSERAFYKSASLSHLAMMKTRTVPSKPEILLVVYL